MKKKTNANFLLGIISVITIIVIGFIFTNNEKTDITSTTDNMNIEIVDNAELVDNLEMLDNTETIDITEIDDNVEIKEDNNIIISEQTNDNTQITKDSDLIIPLNNITEQASFYPVEVSGTQLEVVAVEAPDGTVRTAFNTCQVCYNSGRGYYEQEGDVLVCQDCGNQFKMDEVEILAGGCNPVPITTEYKTVDSEKITISKDVLEQAKIIFSNWKR